MPFIMVLVLFLSGCATTEFAPQQAAEEVHPRFVELDKQLKEGRITRLEHSRKGLALSRELYPYGTEEQALWAYAIVIYGQLERKEITEDMAQYLFSERTAQYYRERNQREARLRQQYQQGGGVTASDLLMLDAIRRPFDRMRAPTNCQTRNVAGVQYTDCY